MSPIAGWMSRVGRGGLAYAGTDERDWQIGFVHCCVYTFRVSGQYGADNERIGVFLSCGGIMLVYNGSELHMNHEVKRR